MLRMIDDGGRIHIGYSAAFPVVLADALTDDPRWSVLEVVTGVHHEPHPLFDPGLDQPFRFSLLQASGPLIPAIEAGIASVIPCPLSEFPSVCAPGHGPNSCDMSLIQVSAPGPDGRFSMGTGGADQVEIVRQARLVVAEVNPRMPYTYGATELHRDEIDLLIEGEHELPEAGGGGFGDVESAIAAHAAEEISDGATLQFGIGRIPEAIVANLREHRDLGLHSGMIGDACVTLAEAGALTGARKSHDVGKLVGGVVLGTRRVFDWVDRNPDVLMVPAAYSHRAPALAGVERLVAINSVIEVALDGASNAEQIGSRVVSGPGGQPDYALGAHLSPGGVGIVAISSTVGRKPTSRIVPRLGADVPVTIPRWMADRVVTEFGVARLAGATLDERADRLRAIAHPDFRSDLG